MSCVESTVLPAKLTPFSTDMLFSLQNQMEIFGDSKNMMQMSKAELAMRSEDLSVLTGFKGKDKRGRGGKVNIMFLYVVFNFSAT